MASVCIECATLFGDATKGGIGMWPEVCVICGRDRMCAESHYDFGINENDLRSIKQFCQEMRNKTYGKWGMV